MASFYDLQVIEEDVEEQLSDKESISLSGSDSEEDLLNGCDTKLNTSPMETLPQLKKKLFEEFDSLGLCRSKETLYSETDLLAKTFNLVNMHRKMVGRVKDGNYGCAQLRGDKLQLEKQVNSLQKVIAEKDNTIDGLNKKLTLLNMKCEDLEKGKSNLQQEVQGTRKMAGSKNNEWEHKIKQLENENQKLKETCGKNIANYASRDTITAAVLQKYKSNEAYYRETITKLQENNQGLIKQLLCLLEQEIPNTYNSLQNT